MAARRGVFLVGELACLHCGVQLREPGGQAGRCGRGRLLPPDES
jgi:hypothetical protein